MSYICELCGVRPENCACPVIQRPYGLIDAPSASAFFSLLVELESQETYDIPQLERPTELCLSEEQLITDDDFADNINVPYCETCSDFACVCEPNEAYDYDRFCCIYPEDEMDHLIQCPTCEEMIDPNDQNGMCYACFMTEQRLYPDDISMDLRYRDSF